MFLFDWPSEWNVYVRVNIQDTDNLRFLFYLPAFKMSYIRKLAKLQEKEAQQRAAEKEKTSDETPSNSSREQSPQPTDFQQESSLGSLDYEAVTDATENVKSSGKKSYNRWSEKERFDIGKYVAIHGGAEEKKRNDEEE
ncbi:uncharacterized protein LOC130645922 [Hydractinia symbiolongicarpus]|uniref:uncharacterized protein LOC130645922 n=1 Tax=Hydractinia symbiolongicarpus TaxID=13093 RepID=UPI0025506AA7|nr:uncharacterized protein LOC130645922 [Hydractinia symbiolongicarpus]